MLTNEQFNFISLLDQKLGNLENAISYLKTKYNIDDNQARQLIMDYWDTIYNELKTPTPPLKTAGQQTINRTGTNFFYQMGLYTDPKTGNKFYHFPTLVYRLTMLGLSLVAFVWIGGILLGGWGFW